MKKLMMVAAAALVTQLAACSDFEIRYEEGPAPCYRVACTHMVAQTTYVPCTHYRDVWVCDCRFPMGGYWTSVPIHSCDMVTTMAPAHPNGHWVCSCGRHHDE